MMGGNYSRGGQPLVTNQMKSENRLVIFKILHSSDSYKYRMSLLDVPCVDDVEPCGSYSKSYSAGVPRGSKRIQGVPV